MMLRLKFRALIFATLLGAVSLRAQQTASHPHGPHSSSADASHGRGEAADMRRKSEELRNRIFPSGLWWKKPEIASVIGLSPEQSKRMDDLLQENRGPLQRLHTALADAQKKMELLLNANPLDQSRVMAGASQIADLRGELEKAHTRLLLGLRAVLTPDQWTRLVSQQLRSDSEHHSSGEPMSEHGPGTHHKP